MLNANDNPHGLRVSRHKPGRSIGAGAKLGDNTDHGRLSAARAPGTAAGPLPGFGPAAHSTRWARRAGYRRLRSGGRSVGAMLVECGGRGTPRAVRAEAGGVARVYIRRLRRRTELSAGTGDVVDV